MADQRIDQQIPELYRQTFGPLYAYVSRRCAGERALAEDIVQETWLRAVDAWRTDGIPTVPAAWLTTVARNLLINHFRRRRPMVLGVDADSIIAAVDNGLETERAEVAALMQWGIAQLPDAEARVLEAFHIDERPVASIAKDMRLSDRAVEGRLRRARLKLRGVLEAAATSPRTV